MMKRTARALLVLALLLALTAGCAQSPAGPRQAEEPTTITIWTYYNGAQLTSFLQLVEQFNATVGAEEGIVVQTSNYGSVSDLEQSVLDAAQGKVGADPVPNVFAAYADTAYAVNEMGLLVDLSPYFTDEELDEYVDSFVDEGRFTADTLKIFPVAKSTELFLLNKTDWDVFAQATGATCDDFATIEGLTATAQAYYEWTDSLTPDVPNDGKAFFGRDAMANYFLVGSMQLGCEIFQVEDGKMTLNFDKAVMRKLWDNYYVPFVKGYFAASGRFRSDDVKTGNILAFVGSSSGATFFPTEVNDSDTLSHAVEMDVYPCPRFRDGQPYAVQQGAGMVVTTGTDEEVRASVEFLRWFTQDAQDIRFSIGSGYMPVRRSGNQMDAIRAAVPDEITPAMEQILTVAADTINQNTLYTPKAFPGGADARAVLETSMSDLATADRAAVEASLAEGKSLEQAAAPFVGDARFETWYAETLEQLQALADG